jgi:hypothetical protein
MRTAQAFECNASLNPPISCALQEMRGAYQLFQLLWWFNLVKMWNYVALSVSLALV